MSTRDLLGYLSDAIQVFTFLFTIIVLWNTRRRMSEWVNRQKTSSGNAPAALAIGLAGSIEGTVRRDLETRFPHQVPVRTIERAEYVPVEEWPLLVRELLTVKNELTRDGITELHLYYKGPGPLAMTFGAVLDNWVPVFIYEYKDGRYQLATVLEKETVRGLLPTTLEQGEQLIKSRISVA